MDAEPYHRVTSQTAPRPRQSANLEVLESFDKMFLIYLTFISSGAKLAFGAEGMLTRIETYRSLDEQKRWREAENGMIGRDRHA